MIFKSRTSLPRECQDCDFPIGSRCQSGLRAEHDNVHFTEADWRVTTILHSLEPKMSYYFAIIGTRDNPLFEIDFGTSKGSGDGTAHFKKEARHMNQFIVHAALDSVDETQWTTKEL